MSCLILVSCQALIWASEIHVAARDGDLEKLRKLLVDNAALVNLKDSDGNTPLHYAAATARRDVVEYLIKQGASIRAVSKSRDTPLHRAAASVNRDAVELLLQEGADAKASNEHGDTPLHGLAGSSLRDAVKVATLLLAAGAPADTENHKGWRPLHQACAYANRTIAECLLEHGADANKKTQDGRPPLFFACNQYGGLDIVKLLVAKGADVNGPGWGNDTPLHRACAYGQKDIAEFLLTNGANMSLKNAHGQTPFDAAGSCILADVKPRTEIQKFVKEWSAAKALPQAVDAAWVKQGDIEYSWKDDKTLLARTSISGQWLGAVVKSYAVKKDMVALCLLESRSKAPRSGKDSGQLGVTWQIPVPRQDNLKLQFKEAKVPSKDLFATPFVVRLKDPRPVGAVPTTQVRANLVHYVEKADAYLIFPASAKPTTDIETVPLWIPATSVATITIGNEATWQPDERDPLAVLTPSLETITGIRSCVRIDVPAMEQDYTCGCALNAFKLALHCANRPASNKELLGKLDLTTESINRRGIPWAWMRSTDGEFYKKLQIDQALVLLYGEGEACGTASAPLQDVSYGFGSQQKAVAPAAPPYNWLFHGLLKTYVAKGLPVIMNIYVTARASHMVTILGYDEDKKAYYVNYGRSKEVERIACHVLDADWARMGYPMIVVDQNRPPAALPERTYTLNAPVIATGVLKAVPETEGQYVYLQEEEFSNGIHLRATPALTALIGRRVKLAGTVAEEVFKNEGIGKKLLVLQNPRVEK
jgi:ankyrin repeat protein